MRYCTQCGRPLQDGEVCNCQSNTAKGQSDVSSQAGMAGGQTSQNQSNKVNLQKTEGQTGAQAQQTVQPQQQTQAQQTVQAQQAPTASIGAQQNAQSQQAFTASAGQNVQSAKPIITKEQATAISMSLLSYAKDFVKNPVEASKAVVGEHSITTVAGLVVVNAALELIYGIIALIISTANGRHFVIGNLVRTILRPIIWWVAIPAAFAGLIWLCAKYIEGQDVSFKKALSVFAIPALPLLVFTLIKIIRLVLTHVFFGVIFGVISAAISGAMLYLSGVGIVNVIQKTDKFVYSIAIICAGLYFVNWLVTVAIF